MRPVNENLRSDYAGVIQLTRAQRRQLQNIAARIDRVTQADRRFFERRPDRRHRVRLASKAEVEEREIVTGPMNIPAGFKVFTVVRCLAPGIRVRALLPAPEGRETDVDEATAKAIFAVVESDSRRTLVRARDGGED